MPVTLKLSRKFYEALGEDVTNEFVDALNSVDAAYRSELRDTLEHHFSRFEARLEQRLAEFARDLADRLAQLESRLTWRMFAFWAPTALAVIGSSAGVISLLLRR
ncbi:MAG: hypothetical protein Q8R92_08345 [Deltaproteobacteria bacterium]|nr:hypothetical protein [Deltaproteobacteria bacterium]